MRPIVPCGLGPLIAAFRLHGDGSRWSDPDEHCVAWLRRQERRLPMVGAWWHGVQFLFQLIAASLPHRTTPGRCSFERWLRTAGFARPVVVVRQRAGSAGLSASVGGTRQLPCSDPRPPTPDLRAAPAAPAGLT